MDNNTKDGPSVQAYMSFSGKPEDFDAYESGIHSYFEVHDNVNRRKNLEKKRNTYYYAAKLLHEETAVPDDVELTPGNDTLSAEQLKQLAKRIDYDTATSTIKLTINKTLPRTFVTANQQFIRDNTPFAIWTKIKSRYSTRTFIHLRGMVWKMMRMEPRNSNSDTLFDFIYKMYEQINQMGKMLLTNEEQRPLISHELLCLMITGFLTEEDFNHMQWDINDFTIDACRAKLKNRFGGDRIQWRESSKKRKITAEANMNFIATGDAKKRKAEKAASGGAKKATCFHCGGPHYKNDSRDTDTKGCPLFKTYVNDIISGLLNTQEKKEARKQQDRATASNNTKDMNHIATEELSFDDQIMQIECNTQQERISEKEMEDLDDLIGKLDYYNSCDDEIEVRIQNMILNFNDTDNLLVCDSGAGTSVGHRKVMFDKIYKSDGINLRFPNGTTSNSGLNGTMSLKLNTFHINPTFILKIHDVPYNNKVTNGIIQEYELLKAGFTVSNTTNGLYKIYTNKNRSNFFLAKAIKGIYYIHNTTNINKDMNSLNIVGKRNLEMIVKRWHMILGHCHHERLAAMALQYDIPEFRGYSIADIMNAKYYCNTCPPAKMKQLPFRSKTGGRPLQELMCLHSDSNGPFKVSGHFGTNIGIKHILVIIDDHTSYKWVFFLKTLKELSQTFIEHLTYLQKQFPERPVQKLRTDGHTTFKRGKLEAYCKEHGIHQQFSNVETQQENGGPERHNRTLLEGARALLKSAALPLHFWPEAVNTMNDLTNLLITARLKKTPHETIMNKSFNYSLLRMFGAVCDVYIPPKKRTDKKLGDHSVRCKFVGYSTTHKAYRLITCGQYPKSIINGNVKFNDEYIKSMVERNYNISEEPVDDIPLTIPNSTDNTTLSAGKASGNVGVVDINENDHEQVGRAHIFTSSNTIENTSHSDSPQKINKKRKIPERPRRSTRAKKAPKRLLEINQLIAQIYADDKSKQKRIKLPKSFKTAMLGSDKELWKAATDLEYKAMIDNKTWSLVKLPPGRKVLRHQWLLSIKYKSDGEIERYKARIVLLGNHQIYGVDFLETFAPVSKYESFRLLLAISAKLNLTVHQMDVKTAFLNSEMDTEIYMTQPHGYVGDPQLVCKLHKSIYGAKQAGRLWAKLLHKTLTELNYTNTHKDVCFYQKKRGDSMVLLLVYVDDIILASKDLKYLQTCKDELSSKFAMKDLGNIDYALKIKVRQDLSKGTISLSQRQYILDKLDEFDMELISPVATPENPNTKLESGEKMSEYEIKQSPYKYRELVGAFQYLVRGTRPDIANAVRELSKHLTCFTQTHWIAAIRVLKYLKGTLDYGLVYHNKDDKLQFELYADASFGAKEDGRYSVTGWATIMSGSAISYKSQKMDHITISTAEAELVACSEACRESEWTRQILEELDLYDQGPAPITVHCDNMATNLIVQNPGNHKCTKHIEIRHLYARELQDQNKIKIQYCSTLEMTADIFTKALPTKSFIHCRDLLGMELIENS